MVISAINGRLLQSEVLNPDECESSIEALGQIGLSAKGAAFTARGKQLAALHALANLAGIDRPESSFVLDGSAEEGLRLLIYETASHSSKLTPSGIFLSVVQQDPEVRLAAYRAFTALASRPWCLVEICSREEIIDIVTDPGIETTKIGMEVRHNCCEAIYKAFTSSTKLANDPSLARIAIKLQEAVRRGPYLARKHQEAQPAVMTAERF
ncbi:hypothetical protein MLD38_000626 [Melastoma candidum]|uniref:Uncharacterized protein n=1 Tax=Melastoma candidum TaxID=119954 RepID=A0ACB9SB48_9MYRT|nr:hypothetical protein MLD38_000626 [Melastoma candidum]